jgi:hypothetical protein
MCGHLFGPEASNTKILYVNGELFFIIFVIRALVNVIILHDSWNHQLLSILIINFKTITVP